MLPLATSQHIAATILVVILGLGLLFVFLVFVGSFIELIGSEPGVLLFIPGSALVVGLVGTAIFGHFLMCLGVGAAIGVGILVLMALADM